jgi:hypothetical protein
LARRSWVKNPDTGGVRIPKLVQQRTHSRLQRHSENHFSGRFTPIEIRFRAQLCSIDAYTEPVEPGPNWHQLSRLRARDGIGLCALFAHRVLTVARPA